ncbi:MAG TPA: hypothetical protein VI457_02500 [Methylococcaceae bacterium]|nr:hypothetical protein [Methylococcaceae bacterium]
MAFTLLMAAGYRMPKANPMGSEVIKGISRSQAIKWLVFYPIVGGLPVFLAKTLLFPWIKDYLPYLLAAKH